ncbi:MAG TPA: metallophosphoesterase [Microthrixaceae bacterium]|nr:metallophosphoesterase [Microthrixaceae bacterium]
MELTTVADDEVVLFDGNRLVSHSGLEPDTVHHLDGVEARTLPRPGDLLSRFCTTNDVHFGETVCGVIEGSDAGPVFSVPPGAEPYPEVMNRGAVAEIAAVGPDAVVVKGDLTAMGTRAEYDRFVEVYQGAFGDRLWHVRGNHDAYHGEVFADWPTQEIDLPGVRLAILDTSRGRQVNGSLSADQLEWLDELGARADRPVLVFGHHHIWNPARDPRIDSFFGLRPDDSEALLAVFARRPRLRGYFAGHTHRNQRQMIGGIPFVEVACVKDFPGTWAEYRVFDGGILQIFRRIGTADALDWSEQTRHMYAGGYEPYAFGDLDDRSFLIPIR